MAFSIERINTRILNDFKNYIEENILDRRLAIALAYPNFESTTPTHIIFISMEMESQVNSDDKSCPFCSKVFSSKCNRDRHVNNYCKLATILDNKYEINTDLVIKNILPNLDLRSINYIGGPQGSGKSTYVKNYIIDYMRIFMPYEDDDYNRVVLFSKLKHDDVLADLESVIVRPDINDIVENPINPGEDLKATLSIFDDYTSFDKEPKEVIEGIINDVMEIGRDHHGNKLDDIYVVIVRHMLLEYRKTRGILFECSTVTFFPHSGMPKQIQDVLSKYCGFSKKTIDKILSLNSRWVTVSVRYPCFVLHAHGAFIPRQ